MEHKRCPKCGDTKPVDQFGKDKSTQSGIACWCKSCRYASVRRWEKAHPGACAKRNKKWRETHREAYAAQRKAEYDADPEKFRQASREKYWRDPELYRRKRREYHKKHPHASRDYQRKLYATNPGFVKAHVIKRKALKLSAEGSFSAEDIARIYKQQRGRCAYCAHKLGKKYAIDHITALSKGGTNWPRNLQLACQSCNSSKHNKDPIAFAQSLGRML